MWTWIAIGVLFVIVIIEGCYIIKTREDDVYGNKLSYEQYERLRDHWASETGHLEREIDDLKQRNIDYEREIRRLKMQINISVPTKDEDGDVEFNSSVPVKAVVFALLGSLGLNMEKVQSHIKLNDIKKEKENG